MSQKLIQDKVKELMKGKKLSDEQMAQHIRRETGMSFGYCLEQVQIATKKGNK